MTGYQLCEDDLEHILPKYICKHCHLMLRDPVQTPCAHFYCRGCFEHLKRDAVFKCKVDDEEFNAAQVFPDGCVKKEIQSLTVHCLHIVHGCEWEGKITNLEGHLANCDYEEINCIYEDKCKTKLLKKDLAQHLEKECSQRKAECEHCRQELPFSDLEDHNENACQSFPVKCILCNKDIPRGNINAHRDPENGDCEGSKALCPFRFLGCETTEEMKRSERREHDENLVVFHLGLLVPFILRIRDQLGFFVNEIKPLREGVAVMGRLKSTVSQLVSQVTAVVRENGAIQDELHDLRSRLMHVEDILVEPDSVPTGQGQHGSLTAQYQQITNVLDDVKRAISNMQGQFANHELLLAEANQTIHDQNNEIVWLKRQDERNRELLRRLQAKVDSMEEATRTRNMPPVAGLQINRDQEPYSFDGVLLWRISNVSAKIYDSFNEPEKSYYSPPFYTSRQGYKMCARIYLNGDGTGKGTHISLFFVLMRGEYDALLRWPFRQKVTFMMLDQNNVEHVIDAFRPDPNSSSFHRPRRETNIASGCPLFFPLTELNKHAYIKDDVMFVKVIVDCSDL